MVLKTMGFNASFGTLHQFSHIKIEKKKGCSHYDDGTAFYLLSMGLFSFACTLCALKTNIALVGVELFLTLSFPSSLVLSSNLPREGRMLGVCKL